MADGKKSRDFRHSSSQSHGGARVVTQSQKTLTDSHTYQLLQHVFPEQCLADEAMASGSEKSLGLHNLQGYIDQYLDDATICEEVQQGTSTADVDTGKLGPNQVVFDNASNVGTVVVEPDRLGLSSQSNFSTLRANCCVFKGKWIYELMLGSKGVMQLGWCTINCKFSQEEGVGDTADSYAYDGSRLRKWNIQTQKYGELWLTGDVISCAIDCDNATISFFRNGKSLGLAFKDIKIGPKYAYFPAVSLSRTESLRANFGATPLKYPLEGYRALQDPPQMDLMRADVLFGYLEKLLPLMVDDDKCCAAEMLSGKHTITSPVLSESRTRRATSMLVAAHIFEKVAPLLKSAYIVEECLLKFLLKFCDSSTPMHDQPYVTKMLDLMWSLMQEFELKSCMENLIISLLSAYRFSPVMTDFMHPRVYLSLTLAILKHEQTRRHLLMNVLFDKIKFPIFLHIKPPDDLGLAEIVPAVWWDKHIKDDEANLLQETADEIDTKSEYMNSCDKLRQKIEGIEEMQIELLKLLLINNDVKEGKSTRDIFIEKLRIFLKENSGFSPIRVHQIKMCPLPVTLCFFHRLVRALRFYWDELYDREPDKYVSSSEAFMPIQKFWTESRDYFEFQRLGGLMSHLQRVHGDDVNKLRETLVHQKTGSGKSSAKKSSTLTEDYPKLEIPIGEGLTEILDGIVMLYHIAAHKQLGKMCTLRDNMKEFIISLQDTEDKMKKCPEDLVEVQNELMRARNVFLEKITEQGRQMGWVIAVIYSKAKQQDISWVLTVLLNTVEKASKYHHLFQFIPEFYIETCINTYSSLKNYFHPTIAFEHIEDYEIILNKFAMFITKHFADSRIVNADVRDNLVQSLACFCCFSQSLRALESLPKESCISMLKSLIAPYENRSWAHTNWILVRIWKGCGFGFRYTHLPHLVPSRIQPNEIGFASLQKPCPSKVFQTLLKEIFNKDGDDATKFLDTLLNQLNWSFSEFIGMMQEIQAVITRVDLKILESRQLKICATCYELSVSLMRVIEMVVCIVPEVFTDWSRPSAELLLRRLVQSLCQVLNRITTKNGVFENVSSLSLPGLESVTYYPILAVATGILIQLVMNTKGQSLEKATQVLVTEPSFQLDSLEFLLGKHGDEESGKGFNLNNFKEVSQDEVASVEAVISYLKKEQQINSAETENIKEDELCTICYANVVSAIFTPCGHMSCRTCISHQLMSKKECFFCKATITALHDMKGKAIMQYSK